MACGAHSVGWLQISTSSRFKEGEEGQKFKVRPGNFFMVCGAHSVWWLRIEIIIIISLRVALNQHSRFKEGEEGLKIQK
jgi:hypothetical protein